jgi:hypothetical protein
MTFLSGRTGSNAGRRIMPHVRGHAIVIDGSA